MHDETWAAAVRYAVDQGTDVINMSFGNDYIAELRAANAFPPVGTRTVECAQGRSNLECVEEVKATPNPLFRRVEVRVYHGAVRSHMLAELIGILPRR